MSWLAESVAFDFMGHGCAAAGYVEIELGGSAVQCRTYGAPINSL